MMKRMILSMLCVAAFHSGFGYAQTAKEVLREVAPPANKDLRNVVVYQFGPGYPIPQSGAPDLETSGAWLVTINRVTNPLISSLGGGGWPVDFNLFGDPGHPSCTENRNAYVGSTNQSWWLYTVAWAASFLKGRDKFPAVIINANYFDVRPQLNGTTWLSNNCSRSLGVFYDQSPGAISNDYRADDKYIGGPGYFIHPDGSKNPLQNMVFYMGSDHVNPITWQWLDRGIQLVENSSADDVAFKNALSQPPYNYDNTLFSAVSGAELLPVMDDPSTGPDTGNKATTRIGIAYKKSSDQFFILEGGSYTGGLTRKNLASAFRALGADIALELDGGGSAAVAVNMLMVEWAGASTDIPESSCNDNEYICAPITQPSGKARPVPGYLYITVPPESLDRPQIGIQ